MAVSEERFNKIWDELEKHSRKLNYLEATLNNLAKSTQRLGKTIQRVLQTDLEFIETVLTDNNFARQVENNEYLNEEDKAEALRKDKE